MMYQSRDFRNPSNASRTACERDRIFPLSIRSSSLSSIINGRLTVTLAARWLGLLGLPGNIDTPHRPHFRFRAWEVGGLRRRRTIVSAIRPPNSPARIDSIGKPGTPHVPGGIVVVEVPVIVVDPVKVIVVVVPEITVVVPEVVVPGTNSGP